MVIPEDKERRHCPFAFLFLAPPLRKLHADGILPLPSPVVCPWRGVTWMDAAAFYLPPPPFNTVKLRGNYVQFPVPSFILWLQAAVKV